MKTGWLLSLAAFVLHASAKRVQIQQVLSAKGNETAEDALADQGSSGETIARSSSHKGSPGWEPVGLVNDQYTQQFKLKEDYRLFQPKKYKVDLEQYEDPNTGVELRKDIDARVMTVTNHFFTMHATQTAILEDVEGNQIGDYTLFTPHVINRHYTWRVVKTADLPAFNAGDKSKLRFTIQKRLYDDHCKHLGMFSCKPVLKIYEGAKGDKSTLIYYGVGDKDLDEPDFKFYHSLDKYKENKKKWVAKVDHKKHDHGDGEDKYKVKVKPGEDAFLILFATMALDVIGDDARSSNSSHDYHDDHYD